MTINSLNVLWIDTKLRERHFVGVLRRSSDHFAFCYGDVSEAISKGFAPMPEFRETDREYTSSKLFATFAERLPNARRSDRAELLGELGLSEPADDFDILARSGGLLATDRIELAEERVVGDTFERPLHFQVRGTQFNAQPEENPLHIGEELYVRREPTNEFDPNACALHRSNGDRAGFIPKSYSAAVAAAVGEGATLKVTLRRTMVLPRQPPPSPSRPTWVAELVRDER